MRIRTVMAAAVMAAAVAAGAGFAAEPVVGVRSVRVGAVDVPKTAAFYQAVFGYKEVGRNERPGLAEIILNVGATVEEAKASRATKIVIINQAADAKAPVSNIVLRCTEIATIVARAKANGGTIEREPTKSATSTAVIAFIVDPAGNRIEVIQE